MAETNVGQHYQKEPGNALSRHRVERTCIGCRAQREAYDLVRFACTPQGQVICGCFRTRSRAGSIRLL